MGVEMSLRRVELDNTTSLRTDWDNFNTLHLWFDGIVGGFGWRSEVEVQHADLVELRDKIRLAIIYHEPIPTNKNPLFKETEVNRYYWSRMLDTWQDLNRMLDSVEVGTRYFYSANW